MSHQQFLWSEVLAGKSNASLKVGCEIEERSDINTESLLCKLHSEDESGLCTSDPISCAARFFVEEVGSTSASDSASPYSDGELPANPCPLVDEDDGGPINGVDDMDVLGRADRRTDAAGWRGGRAGPAAYVHATHRFRLEGGTCCIICSK